MSMLSALAVIPAGTALIMGGTGVPTPPQSLLDLIDDTYIDHLYPGTYTDVLALTTPETITAQSYFDGQRILVDAINGHAPDDPLLVFGVSQSAGIIGMALADPALDVDPGAVRFVVLAPPNMPGGRGLFTGDLYDLLANAYSGPVTDDFPLDSGYDVDIYCGQYDPVCDWPADPGNLLADVNALAAVFTVHLGYGGLSTADVDAAVLYETAGDTSVYMIPTEHLPLLAPFWGTPVADWLDPIVRPVVDAAYEWTGEL